MMRQHMQQFMHILHISKLKINKFIPFQKYWLKDSLNFDSDFKFEFMAFNLFIFPRLIRD